MNRRSLLQAIAGFLPASLVGSIPLLKREPNASVESFGFQTEYNLEHVFELGQLAIYNPVTPEYKCKGTTTFLTKDNKRVTLRFEAINLAWELHD